MRTNAVFSRIALVSCFCAESQLSGKTPEKIANLLFYQKTHGARRGVGDGPRVAQTTRRRGQGAHRAARWCGHLGHAPEPLSRLLNPFELTKHQHMRKKSQEWFVSYEKRYKLHDVLPGTN